MAETIEQRAYREISQEVAHIIANNKEFLKTIEDVGKKWVAERVKVYQLQAQLDTLTPQPQKYTVDDVHVHKLSNEDNRGIDVGDLTRLIEAKTIGKASRLFKPGFAYINPNTLSALQVNGSKVGIVGILTMEINLSYGQWTFRPDTELMPGLIRLEWERPDGMLEIQTIHIA